MMNWGAPNTGYYADLGPGLGQINCQPRLVLRQAAIAEQREERESYVRLHDRVVKCGSLTLGVPRPGHVADFKASFTRNAGGGAVVVGFIQNLLSSERTAHYRGGGPAQLLIQHGAGLIGGGLLDCGTDAPPWFKGRHIRLLPPAPGQSQARPAMVEADDNPNWNVPLKLEDAGVERGAALPLARVVLKDHYRVFGAAQVNNRVYVPICRTEWKLDIEWDPVNGLRAKVTQVGPWTAALSDRMVTTGPRANEISDRIRELAS